LLGGSVGEAAVAVAGAGDTTFLVRRMREGMKRHHTIIWEKRCGCDCHAVLWWWWKSLELQTGERLRIMSLVCYQNSKK
jgi:hypothetical protein